MKKLCLIAATALLVATAATVAETTTVADASVEYVSNGIACHARPIRPASRAEAGAVEYVIVGGIVVADCHARPLRPPHRASVTSSA